MMMGPKRRDDARSQGDNIYRPSEGVNAIEPQPLNPYLPDKIWGPLLTTIVAVTDLLDPFGSGGLLQPFGPQGTLIPGDIPPQLPPNLPPKEPGSGGDSTGGGSGGSTGGGIVRLTFQAYSVSGNYSAQRSFNGELWYASSSSTSSSGQKIDAENKIVMQSEFSYSYFAKNYPPSSGGRGDTHISQIPRKSDLLHSTRAYLGFWGGAPLYGSANNISSYFLDGGGPLRFDPLYVFGSEKGISQWLASRMRYDNWSYTVDRIDWISEIYAFGKITGSTSQSSSISLIYEEPAGEYQNPNFFNGGGSPPPPSKECEGDCMGCDCTTTADLFAQLIFQQQKREDDLKEFIQRTALEQLEITKKMLGNIELSADYQPIIDRIAKAESTLWNGVK